MSALTRGWVLGLSLALLSAGCTQTKVGECGEGTIRNDDGVCVAETDPCGPGTTLVDGECVAALDGGSPDEGSPDLGEDPGPDSGPDEGPDLGPGETDLGPCIASCEGKVCGSDGCGGSCGECAAGETCSVVGTCEVLPDCIPECVGKACGSDGCGGSCGSCDDPLLSFCDEASGQCVEACIPDCVGKACGPDGCGGTCGACDAGEGCSNIGHCVPDTWTCAPAAYGTVDACDCGCGLADPDCAIQNLVVVGCDPDAQCVAGSCEPLVPAAWTCTDLLYDDGILCDCECGVPDPDCEEPLTVNGCDPGETCDDAGQCVACVPDCTGKACGDDGCGGSCGGCVGNELACVDGACVPGCGATPLACQTNVCGDDGCGGSCGTCPANTFCTGGQCQVDPGFSCQGYCNAAAPGGCGCDQGCIGQGDCCPDYVELCVCLPDCSGKVCGDDGCGGTCGSCAEPTPFCGATGQCEAACTPSCQGKVCGDDGCGGSCGDCAEGEACNGSGVCAPATWACPGFWYEDGGTCDCGCGAPDPDCLDIGLTSGCPLGAECNDASGYCDIAFCSKTAECDAPSWCVGHYLAGEARRRGVCQPPEPQGFASGAACASDFSCATGVCAAGLCRDHCAVDADCLEPGASCLGIAFVDGLSLEPLGVVTVCDAFASAGAACAAQSECDAGQTCLAFIDPGSLQASYRCGVLPGGIADENEPCEGNYDCQLGLICAQGECMRACPGGQADCPPTSTCGTAVLHGGASALAADDVLADICVPD